jgi:signal transduction histidine kinase
MTRLLLAFTRCEEVSLWLREPGAVLRVTGRAEAPDGITFARMDPPEEPDAVVSPWERYLIDLIRQAERPVSPRWTGDGESWLGDEIMPPGLAPVPAGVRSVAILPLDPSGGQLGLVVLLCSGPERFTETEIQLYGVINEAVSVALGSQGVQASLRERIKELTCLYGIARLAAQPDLDEDALLTAVVRLLPAAWQYPEHAAACLELDGRTYLTAGYTKGGASQCADVVVEGRRRGAVTVCYRVWRPWVYEGPFLAEERHLLDAVATQIALLCEEREANEESRRLAEQLRHADRLATIGQLAAGVAHELNEPLGNVLGFAQLLQQSPHLPEADRSDLDRIVVAALHAREVVSKLRVFARQTPPEQRPCDLNQIVEQGLYFLESRCAKQSITLVRALEPRLPAVVADGVQLYQVLVNLVVNALQAMPQGGEVRVSTRATADSVVLEVTDTGIGMTSAVKGRVFEPFFTTKDVNEGTGLGLSVVHGIVTAHRGEVRVESEPGRGARFTVVLPLGDPPERGASPSRKP